MRQNTVVDEARSAVGSAAPAGELVQVDFRAGEVLRGDERGAGIRGRDGHSKSTVAAERWLRARRTQAKMRALLADEAGAVTAEYALVIMAGVAFAGLLIIIMRSEEVRSMLVTLVQNALGSGG